MTSDYRARLYEKYASSVMGTPPVFDPQAADRWGKAYDYYVRGWLPAQKDTPILELACGGGRLLHFLKQRGFTNLTGVDISPEQIALAKQVTGNVHQASVFDFLQQNSRSFDLIIGLDVIEHLFKDEALRLLDLVGQALKPNGRLILQTLNASNPWALTVRYGDFTHEIAFTADCLQRLMKLCGFQQIEAREQGPVPWGYGLKSCLRNLLWKLIRLGMKIWNLAETGSAGDPVLTRNFLVSGIVPEVKSPH
jgi:SAM-dependent methyltransferase